MVDTRETTNAAMVRLLTREALVMLHDVLNGDRPFDGETPRFFECKITGPATQAFIGLYMPMNFLDRHVSFAAKEIARAIEELARRIKGRRENPCARRLETPVGVEAVACEEFRGIAMRTIVMDHPAMSASMARDLGAVVVPYYNTDVDAFEQRCCVKAVRFDVPLEAING